MKRITINSKVDEGTWNELQALAGEKHRNVSELVREAIRDYVRDKRLRPQAIKHLDNSIHENEELGRLLSL